MTSIKRTLLLIQTWRLYFDEKYRIVSKLPHPLGRLRSKPSGGHIWFD